MIKRCIGIDVGRSHVRAVQIARTPEGLLLEKAFGMQARRSTDSLPEILRSLAAEHGFDRHADVAVSMPSHTVFFSDVQTDAAGLGAVRAGDALRLRDDLPIAAEDAIIRVYSVRALPQNKYSVLLAATSGELIREHLQPFEEAHIRPAAVEASIVAVHAAVATNHPEIMARTALILSVDESILTLAVIRGANILIVRNIPLPSDTDAPPPVEQIADIVEPEVEITWKKLFSVDPDKDLGIFLVAAPQAAQALAAAIQERLECRIVIADPLLRVKRPDEATAVDSPFCAAEGLALRALNGPQANDGDFLVAYNSLQRPGRTIRKELLVCAALLAVTALVWFAGLFVRLSALESQYAQLKEQIQSVFHQALPRETAIVEPLVQLQQKLDAFREEYEMFSSFRPGRFTPLEIMYMLTAHTPATGGLRFRDLLITTDSVQAMGSCDSFAVLSEWQRLLKQIPGFDVVDIQNQKKDARTGQVQFTLSMSAAGGRV
jgi:Tfp pilus assembly PilM family ATPase